MAVTISCVHGFISTVTPTPAPISAAGPPGGSLTVRSIEHIMHRLIYHHPNGEEWVTPYRPCVNPTKSEPLNPFCAQCVANFLNHLTNYLGFTPTRSHQELHNLRDRVYHKLQLLNDNHHLEDDHDYQFYYDYEVMSLTELHTWHPEHYLAWILVEEVAAGRKRALHAAIEALERVECPLEEDCAVCLEEMGPTAKKEVLKLPCQHAFHDSCILEWLSRGHLSCPLCRFQLPPPTPTPNS